MLFMRIWSIHPQYLDAKGLVALWREALLAQNVLLGKTKGYKKHPQLLRFKRHENPTEALANYLHCVCDEAEKRSYTFNRDRICYPFNPSQPPLYVTEGQLGYEWQHFLSKIKIRDPERFKYFYSTTIPEAHQLFTVVKGDIEAWEVMA